MTEDLASLIRKHPGLMRVLDENGIHFCAGCYLTLSSTPERAAAYHGVPAPAAFARRLREIAAKGHPARRHGSSSRGRRA